jgi:hypothetical protein
VGACCCASNGVPPGQSPMDWACIPRKPRRSEGEMNQVQYGTNGLHYHFNPACSRATDQAEAQPCQMMCSIWRCVCLCLIRQKQEKRESEQRYDDVTRAVGTLVTSRATYTWPRGGWPLAVRGFERTEPGDSLDASGTLAGRSSRGRLLPLSDGLLCRLWWPVYARQGPTGRHATLE